MEAHIPTDMFLPGFSPLRDLRVLLCGFSSLLQLIAKLFVMPVFLWPLQGELYNITTQSSARGRRDFTRG